MEKSSKKISSIVSATFIFLFVFTSNAMADTPTLVSGTNKLFSALTGWLLILVPVTTAALAGWHYWLKSMNQSDPAEAAHQGKAAKQVIVAGIIITCISGLIKTLLAFYA